MQNANVKAQDPATYDIVQAFMKAHPKVKVVIQGQPVAQHEQDMEVAAQSGTLPDIFWVYDTLAQPMAQHGDLLNLTPILQSQHLTADFSPNMLDGFKLGSVQSGLPYQSLVTGFYYNKAIFAGPHLEMHGHLRPAGERGQDTPPAWRRAHCARIGREFLVQRLGVPDHA